MMIDGRLRDTGVGCVFAVEEGETELVFYDDLTGEALDFDGVVQARKEEIGEFLHIWAQDQEVAEESLHIWVQDLEVIEESLHIWAQDQEVIEESLHTWAQDQEEIEGSLHIWVQDQEEIENHISEKCYYL